MTQTSCAVMMRRTRCERLLYSPIEFLMKVERLLRLNSIYGGFYHMLNGLECQTATKIRKAHHLNAARGRIKLLDSNAASF
jgi:hypothetical protein